MCGIVGYIGYKNAKEIILSGLKRLEYRGYDSAGITTFENNKILTTKFSGKVKDLEKKITSSHSNGNVGMGHTRWATHGKPNNINAHPHNDSDNNISLIHNGIIENYYSIKEFLLKNNYELKSETDTEVLVQLISHIYSTQKIDFSEAVRLSLNEVVGAYGIVTMSNDNPNEIVAARLGSPLIIGIGKDEYFIASDSSPIIEYTRNIIILDEGEMAIISKDGYEQIRIIRK